MIAAMQGDKQFLASTSCREQCAHACRILRIQNAPPTPFKIIGRLFNVNSWTVANHWRNYRARQNEFRMPGRPAALTLVELDDIIATILRAFRERRPLTLPEIAAVLRAKFNKVLLPDTLYHALTRDLRVRCCQAEPIDERRMQVSDDAIRDYFAQLFATVSRAPSHFVFKINEMSHQA
jgi:hypothetical protein